MSHDPPEKAPKSPEAEHEEPETEFHQPTEDLPSYRSTDTPIISRLTPYPDLRVLEQRYPGSQVERQPFVPIPPAIALEVAGDLHLWVQGVDPKGRQFLPDLYDPMRVDFFQKWGIWLPPLTISVNNQWKPGSFQISLYDVPVTAGIARRDHLLVAEQRKRLDVLGVDPEPARHPVWQRPASWVHRQHSHLFMDQRVSTWDCGEYLCLLLSTTALTNASEFVGIQEVKAMLAGLASDWPDLVAECLNLLPLPRLRRVLRTLAQEHVTLYPLRHILEILVDAAEYTQDTEALVDIVRHKMQRHLCHRHAANFQILGYLLESSLETALSQQFLTQNADPPASPDVVQERRGLWDALFTAIDKHLTMIPVDSQIAPVLLVQDRDLRRPLQRLIQAQFPWLDVLFVGEIAANFQVLPIATIALHTHPTALGQV